MINKIQTNKASITFTDEGNGNIVLLLHGFPSCIFFWDDIKADLLDRGYRVIVVEQRGYPLSLLKEHSIDSFNIEFLASDIEYLILEVANNNPINIVGHDWGAVVGWAISMRSNIFVNSYTSICGGDEFPPSSVYSKFTFNNNPHYITSFQNPYDSSKILNRNLDLFFRSAYRNTTKYTNKPSLSIQNMFTSENHLDLVLNNNEITKLINHFNEYSLEQSISWYANIDKNIKLSNTWRKNVDFPCYFIYGEYDQAIQLSPGLNDRILKLGSDINLSVIKKAGHWLPITHKKSVLETIYRVIDK